MIDPSIYGQIQTPQQPDSLAKYAQVQGIMNSQNQAKLADLAYGEKQKDIENTSAMNEAYKGSLGADGTLDRNALYKAVAERGQGSKLPGMQEGFAKADKESALFEKARSDKQKTDIETHLKKFEVLGQIVNGVTDQATWDAVRKEVAMKIGPDYAAQMPEVYDPAIIKANMKKAISLKDQLEADLKRLHDETIRRGQDMVDARARDKVDTKPMPATALKMQNEALDMIGIASSIQADLGTIENQLKEGTLNFGPVSNLANNARNLAGLSNEESRNFSTFKSSMEKLRNDSLRLNKGVQTDGDAQRAWNELFQNINDKGLVKQRLAEIKAINSRAVELRKREVEDIRNNYGQQQYDFSTQTNVPSSITPPSSNSSSSPGSPPSTPKAVSAQDQQALDWANANPKDPRSAQIKQRLGQ